MPAKNVPARYWASGRISPVAAFRPCFIPAPRRPSSSIRESVDDFRCWDARLSKMYPDHSPLSISIDRSMKSDPFLDLFHPASPGSWP